MTSNPSTPDTDGPKTETTLTTRIRINIPGSRPIPPVVVRKPVKGTAAGGSAPERTEADPAQAPAQAPPRGGPPAPRGGRGVVLLVDHADRRQDVPLVVP
ncbi:hypothetical protein ACEPPI_38260, partial [Streptomyces sp. AB3(2024)]